MRTEAKIAAILSMGIVLVVGLYWMYGAEETDPVELVDGFVGDARVTPTELEDDWPTRSPAREPVVTSPPAGDGRFDLAPLEDEFPLVVEATPTADGPVAPGEVSAPLTSRSAPDETDRTESADIPRPRRRSRRPDSEHETSTSARPDDRLTRIAEARPDARAGSATHDSSPATAQKAVAYDRHIVQQGDSFRSIARMFFGHERHTRYLMNANPDIHDTGPLLVGTVVLIPPDPQEALASGSPTAGQPDTAGAVKGPDRPHKRTYRVQSGDTFYGISRKVLGSSSRWRELFELNRELVAGEPRNLRPGQELVLPDDV